jgi:hypothetical protein
MGNICLTCLIHVSIGRWSVGVIIRVIVVVGVSVRAVSTALSLSVRSGLIVVASLGHCLGHASCELRLELATIGVREAVRP